MPKSSSVTNYATEHGPNMAHKNSLKLYLAV